MVMAVYEIRRKLQNLGNRETAKTLKRFFKTGPGEYAEGDIFLGIRVPDLRKLAKEYQDIASNEITVLLTSPIHEERLLALLILVRTYSNGDESTKRKIYELYFRHIHFINNWDLIDGSAAHIVGAFLMDKSKEPLYHLAQSKNFWLRRISIISTFYFIKHNEFSETLKIAAMLISDKENLIHKAVGWMLREVGNRDLQAEERFLRNHYQQMPRTMLRYATEKFPEPKRQHYLQGKI
jgi:3-methyladenine DNA glycosylase AlkD